MYLAELIISFSTIIVIMLKVMIEVLLRGSQTPNLGGETLGKSIPLQLCLPLAKVHSQPLIFIDR